MKKFSRQRQAIKTFLKHTNCHPTAEDIYLEIKKCYPHIGLATVYRNLKEMQNDNDLTVINCGDHKEHYDGNAFPHAHLFCKKCKAVKDVFLTEEQLNFIEDIYESTDFQLVFSGLCDKCAAQKNAQRISNQL